MDELDYLIRQHFEGAQEGAQKAREIRGNLGRADLPNRFDVQGMPNHVWVKLLIEQTYVAARWTNVGRLFNLPVKLILSNGKYEIIGVDRARMYEVGGDDNEVDLPGLDVGIHDHDDRSHFNWVSSWRLKMGAVYIDPEIGGLTFRAYPARYKHQGQYKTYEGLDSITITAPVTAAKRRWTLIGIDPATNLLTSAVSAEYGALVPIGNAEIDSVTFAGVRLMAVRLTTGQTDITAMEQLRDIRTWLESALSSDAIVSDDIEERLWMF